MQVRDASCGEDFDRIGIGGKPQEDLEQVVREYVQLEVVKHDINESSNADSKKKQQDDADHDPVICVQHSLLIL